MEVRLEQNQKLSQEAQKQIISQVLGVPSKFPDYRFNFGQYRGKSLEYVYKNDRSYLHWLLSEDFINPLLRKRLNNLLGTNV